MPAAGPVPGPLAVGEPGDGVGSMAPGNVPETVPVVDKGMKAQYRWKPYKSTYN